MQCWDDDKRPRYSELSTSLSGEFQWYLDKALHVEQGGEIRTIPAGLRTDFASFPIGVRCVVRHNGRAARPSVAHDEDYRTHRVPRKAADRDWRRGLEAEGAFGPLRRGVMYYTLRAFGWWAWRRSGG